MAEQNLNGVRVAILATDLFEQAELVEPRRALDQAGAKTVVIAPKSGEIQGVNHAEKGKPQALAFSACACACPPFTVQTNACCY